jgi:hypothetical protein
MKCWRRTTEKTTRKMNNKIKELLKIQFMRRPRCKLWRELYLLAANRSPIILPLCDEIEGLSPSLQACVVKIERNTRIFPGIVYSLLGNPHIAYNWSTIQQQHSLLLLLQPLICILWCEIGALCAWIKKLA